MPARGRLVAPEPGARAVQPSADARRLAVDGHEMTPMLYQPDPDSSEGYAVCSCGWVSRTVKTGWLDKVFGDHIAEVSTP